MLARSRKPKSEGEDQGKQEEKGTQNEREKSNKRIGRKERNKTTSRA
jgi:hypothetical protein